MSLQDDSPNSKASIKYTRFVKSIMSTWFFSVQMLEVSNSGMIFMGHGLFYTDMRLAWYSNILQDLECRISNPKEILEVCYFGLGISIFIPGSTGIPELTRHQKKGSTIAKKTSSELV